MKRRSDSFLCSKNDQNLKHACGSEIKNIRYHNDKIHIRLHEKANRIHPFGGEASLTVDELSKH